MPMTRPLILLTTDFSDAARRAYAPTAELAARLGASVLLAHVVEVASVAPHGAPLAPVQVPPDTDVLVREAEARLVEEARGIQGVEGGVETLVRVGGAPAEAIARIAEERSASWVAISTHGRTGLRRL